MIERERASSSVIAFVRGEADIDALEAAGIETNVSGRQAVIREPPGVPVVVPTRQDVAAGLLANYARGTTLRRWAVVVLSANLIDLVALESEDADDPLLTALWAAADGEDPAQDVLAAARHLVDA